MFALVHAKIIEGFYELAEIVQISESQAELDSKAIEKNGKLDQWDLEEQKFIVVEVSPSGGEFNMVQVLKDHQLFFQY